MTLENLLLLPLLFLLLGGGGGDSSVATPDVEVPGSIPAVATRFLLVGSVSV